LGKTGRRRLGRSAKTQCFKRRACGDWQYTKEEVLRFFATRCGCKGAKTDGNGIYDRNPNLVAVFDKRVKNHKKRKKTKNFLIFLLKSVEKIIKIYYNRITK